ncbi:MAG: nucleotidyltransferase family protein [Vicinamibacteria bacterium]
MKLEACVLLPDSTIEDAMRSLDRSGAEISLVVDANGVLLGTVTDGDIRRAMLSGASLSGLAANCMNRKFAAVRPNSGRAEVMDLMQARKLSGIPVVDDKGLLIGLHLIHEIVGRDARPNWAVIMAGGFGSRLWPLTEALPKPMLRVAGRPILERIVLHLVSFGLEKIFISVHYLGDIIEGYFGDGSKFGCQIEYLRERQPLGTGGSLSLLPETPKHPLLVMNGDLVTQADIGRMLDFHVKEAAAATIAVRPHFQTIPFGCVELEGVRVRQMEEKPRIAKLVNAGIYVLDPQAHHRIPAGQAFAITDLFASMLSNDERVCAFEIEDDWIDVGQKDALRQAMRGGETE